VGKPFLHPDDNYIVAVAADTRISDAAIPVIDLNDVEKIADAMQAEAMPAERLKRFPEKV
jgi:molybdopterin-guanine dinucleotide biosynthesis protein B